MCNVRNDIMFSVKELSRGLSAPTEDHLSRLKHLLRYLHGTKHVAQTLRPTLKLHPHHHSLDISMYVDSDWTGCTHTRTHTRRSISGVAVFVLGANVLSHSCTQATVAFSSGEAELYAIGSGTSDALFLRALVLETCLFACYLWIGEA